jgi:hypothetical protein
MELATHFDLLYSNSMCKQSSIPTSILMELFESGGIRNEWTQMSRSFTISAIRLWIVTRKKYLEQIVRDIRCQFILNVIPKLDVDPLVGLMLLLDVLEEEVERLCLSHLSGRSELLG